MQDLRYSAARPANLNRRRRWYSLGATTAIDLRSYYSSRLDGNEGRRAYAAGVIARTFGVDLTPS
jgi:hypothetical protein